MVFVCFAEWVDQVYTPGTVLVGAWKLVYMCFVELEKAFNSVPQRELKTRPNCDTTNLDFQKSSVKFFHFLLSLSFCTFSATVCEMTTYYHIAVLIYTKSLLCLNEVFPKKKLSVLYSITAWNTCSLNI